MAKIESHCYRYPIECERWPIIQASPLSIWAGLGCLGPGNYDRNMSHVCSTNFNTPHPTPCMLAHSVHPENTVVGPDRCGSYIYSLIKPYAVGRYCRHMSPCSEPPFLFHAPSTSTEPCLTKANSVTVLSIVIQVRKQGPTEAESHHASLHKWA